MAGKILFLVDFSLFLVSKRFIVFGIDIRYTIWYINGMDTKERFLTEALQLFRREGYESTGIQKIVDAVGVTKPSLYHYFGSKTGLLKELLESHFNPFLRSLESIASYRGDLVYSIEKIIAHYFHFAEENRDFYRWYMGLEHVPEENEAFRFVNPIVIKQWSLFVELFKAASLDHGNMKGRHYRYAYTLMGIINATISSSMHGLTSLNEESVYQTAHQFMHGIYS